MTSLLRAHEGSATGVSWLSDADVLTCGLDGSVAMFSAPAASAGAAPPPSLLWRAERAHACGVAAVACGAAGAASIGTQGDVTLWPPPGGATARAAAAGVLALPPDEAWRLAHAPVAPQFATGGASGRVGVWARAGGARLAAPDCRDGFLCCVAYAPCGRVIAAGSLAGGVHLIDVETGALLASVPRAHLLPVYGVAFSHDGAVLYSAGADRNVHAYDVSGLGAGRGARRGGSPAGAALIASFVGHLATVTCVATASAGAHLLATASADRTVRLWDARQRQQLHVFDSHTDRVTTCAFSPAGGRVASVSDGGTLGVFSVATFAS